MFTIDQCQGREADLVFLSLTRRPTLFLNKNRFNVALSRVRQKLFFLCDQNEFEAAAMDASWECNLLAKDLLHLAANFGGSGDSDDSDSNGSDSEGSECLLPVTTIPNDIVDDTNSNLRQCIQPNVCIDSKQDAKCGIM